MNTFCQHFHVFEEKLSTFGDSDFIRRIVIFPAMNWVSVCERLLPVLLAAWLYAVYAYTYASNEGWIAWTWNRVRLMVTTIVFVMTADIYRRDPRGKMTLRILLIKYYINVFVNVLGIYGYFMMERASKNVKKQQEELLMKILGMRKDTQYGKDHKFGKIKNVEDFRANHPVTTYSHYENYIERVRKGEENVMANEKVIYYSMTSGTTGKNKVYPYFEAVSKLYLVIFTGMARYLSRTVRDFYNLRSRGNVRIPKEIKKENGIGIGPVSAMSQDKVLMDIFVTPGIVINHIFDEEKVIYIHAVFALSDKDMERIDLPFCSIARSFFHCLEKNSQKICDDIDQGKLSVDIDNKTREILEKRLGKDPARAAELRKEFSKGFKDIAPRIWPYLKSIGMLTSGPLKVQGRALQKRYFGNVEVFSIVHIATEGLYAYNLSPGSVEDNVYTLIVTANFLEFLPIQAVDETEDPEPVLIDEVEIGREYELVVTNVYGLYRYRSGDVVKIVSHYNQIPQYEFRYRLGQMLSVFFERSTEAMVQAAVEGLVSTLPGTELVDYTTVESTGVDEIPDLVETDKIRYYAIFIEVDNDYILTEDDKTRFDSLMCAQNEWYATYRQKGSISTASVHQVAPQTFMKLKQKVLKQNYGVAPGQFKMPRVQRNVDLLEFLAESRI